MTATITKFAAQERGGQRPVRLLICDDSVFMRMALVALCEDHPEIEIVGEAENGLEAVEAATEAIHNYMIQPRQGLKEPCWIKQWQWDMVIQCWRLEQAGIHRLHANNPDHAEIMLKLSRNDHEFVLN